VGGVAGGSTAAGGSVPSIGLSAEDQAKIRASILRYSRVECILINIHGLQYIYIYTGSH
jgi:hypothetical protein